ncbi:MAG: NlpC/P60 family protein [Deltaproteobacteria bacterium]|nr:MAG: NlpC/P60 family protein [Deltaproteobacteria bacterium]
MEVRMSFPWQESIAKRKDKFSFIRFIVVILSVISLCLVFPVSDGLAKTKRPLIVKAKAKKIVAHKKTSRKKLKSRHARKRLKRHIASNVSGARASSVVQKENFVPDRKPLMKVIPLENGDYLLKPLEDTPRRVDGSNVQNKSQEDTEGKNSIADSLNSGGSSKPSQNPVSSRVDPISLKAASPEPTDLSHTDKPREEGYCKRFANLLLTTAKQLLGAPYRLGGVSGLSGIDCSGFVQKVFAKFGVHLPRSSREQIKVGMLVTNKFDWSKLRIGDVLFFRRSPSSGQIGHTGIYIGDGKMIHAARRDRSVTISSLEKPYYKKTFVAAKRFFIFSPPQASNI